MEHLQNNQNELSKKIKLLQDYLEENNHSSEKKLNQIRELSSQFETFEIRKNEVYQLLKKYGDKSTILAGSLFVYTPQETVYLFSGSYPEFNKFYAPALLQDYVMRESIKRGIPCYNLLGITGHFDGSDSVFRFKQNFNGYVLRKMGTFRYYPSPFKHITIQIIKKILNR